MKRIWGQGLTFVLAAGALSVLMPACEDNDRSIFVQAVLAPSTTRTGGSCTYTNDPTQPILPSGRLDVAISQAYIATVLFGNQLIARGDQLQPRAESNRANIQGAVVHLTDANGGTLGDFTSLGTGFADPSSNNVPGYGVTQVPLTDATSAAALAASLKTRGESVTIIASFKLFGTTIGNTDVETGSFDFPLEVCNGCTIFYGKGVDTTPGSPTLGKCALPVDDALLQSTSNPCYIGQDISTDCRLCVTTKGADDVCFNPPTN